jgi:hypothetical protein
MTARLFMIALGSFALVTFAACSGPSEVERYAGLWRLVDGTVETDYAEKPEVVGAIGLEARGETSLGAEFDGFAVELPPAAEGFGLVTPVERPIDDDHSRALTQLDVFIGEDDALKVEYAEEWKERYSPTPGEDGEILCCEMQFNGIATYERSE